MITSKEVKTQTNKQKRLLSHLSDLQLDDWFTYEKKFNRASLFSIHLCVARNTLKNMRKRVRKNAINYGG